MAPPTPDDAVSSKAVNEKASDAHASESPAAASQSQQAESSNKITPSDPAEETFSTPASVDQVQPNEGSNLKSLPALPSSSSAEDMYDLFAPPVSTNVRSKPSMTVVTAADSLLKEDDGVVLPPFRGEVSYIRVWMGIVLCQFDLLYPS